MLENLTWIVLIPLWCSILIMATRFSGIIMHKKQVVVTSCISVLFPLIFSVMGLYYSYNSKKLNLDLHLHPVLLNYYYNKPMFPVLYSL